MFFRRFVGEFQVIHRQKIADILSYLWRHFGNRKSVSQKK